MEFVVLDVFSSLKPPADIAALNESSIGMECVCPPTCSELVRITWIYSLESLNFTWCFTLQRYEVQSILSRRYPEDKLNTTTSGWANRFFSENTQNWQLTELLSNEINAFKCYSDNTEDLDDSTTLKVHFKDLTCIKYRRDMYMTWDGLFGNWFLLIQNPIKWFKFSKKKKTTTISSKTRQPHSVEYLDCVSVVRSSV